MPSSPADPSQPSQLRETIKQVIREVFSDPLHPILDTFMASIPNYLEINPPLLPVSQITGFTKFTASAATSISAIESTSSGTYIDLATVGPQLTNLADGKYVVFVGVNDNSRFAASTTYVGVKVNSTEASDTNALRIPQTAGAQALLISASAGGANTVTMRYRVTDSGGSTSIGGRWMVALKYSNI